MSDIGAVIGRAREEPTTENLERMWQRVMALPAWFLIPGAQGDTPLVSRADDGTWLVVFTHFRPLNVFARAHGLRTEAGEIEMLTVSPRDALARVASVAIHLDGLTFNPGTEVAFRAPLAMLDTLHELLPAVP